MPKFLNSVLRLKNSQQLFNKIAQKELEDLDDKEPSELPFEAAQLDDTGLEDVGNLFDMAAQEEQFHNAQDFEEEYFYDAKNLSTVLPNIAKSRFTTNYTVEAERIMAQFGLVEEINSLVTRVKEKVSTYQVFLYSYLSNYLSTLLTSQTCNNILQNGKKVVTYTLAPFLSVLEEIKELKNEAVNTLEVIPISVENFIEDVHSSLGNSAALLSLNNKLKQFKNALFALNFNSKSTQRRLEATVGKARNEVTTHYARFAALEHNNSKENLILLAEYYFPSYAKQFSDALPQSVVNRLAILKRSIFKLNAFFERANLQYVEKKCFKRVDLIKCQALFIKTETEYTATRKMLENYAADTLVRGVKDISATTKKLLSVFNAKPGFWVPLGLSHASLIIGGLVYSGETRIVPFLCAKLINLGVKEVDKDIIKLAVVGALFTFSSLCLARVEDKSLLHKPAYFTAVSSLVTCGTLILARHIVLGVPLKDGNNKLFLITASLCICTVLWEISHLVWKLIMNINLSHKKANKVDESQLFEAFKQELDEVFKERVEIENQALLNQPSSIVISASGNSSPQLML